MSILKNCRLLVLDKQFEFKYYLFHSRINDLRVNFMDINYFKEFVVLAQTGNFMEAADILYSSQSALSKHIKNMEIELGIPLFDRTTRKVRISKFGELMLPYAIQIVELHDKYTAALQVSLETERDVLNVGSIPALAEYNITDVLIHFKETRRQASLNILQAGSGELKEMLRLRKCELAFIRFADEMDDDLVIMPYALDNLAAVLPINHPLAKEKTIPLRRLEDENLVLSEKQTMLYRISVNACKQSGFEPRIAFTDSKHENILDLVIKGMGIALMMKRLVLYASNPKIAIVDVTPTVTTQISLCYQKDIELSDAAKHFISCAESLIPEFGL
jgi:LysR family transcriptional regulator, transcription activator of glutamate synthase operon